MYKRQELHGVIFKDPMTQGGEETGWVTADEYLSGNVREKLRVAELAAASDSAFAVNTEYLKKAQPKDLDAVSYTHLDVYKRQASLLAKLAEMTDAEYEALDLYPDE